MFRQYGTAFFSVKVFKGKVFSNALDGGCGPDRRSDGTRRRVGGNRHSRLGQARSGPCLHNRELSRGSPSTPMR